MAFRCRVLSTAGAGADLPALPALLAWTRVADLGIFRTQTQAIQFSVFFLLPVFVLSGAFAPLEQLPQAIQYIAELFPSLIFAVLFGW